MIAKRLVIVGISVAAALGGAAVVLDQLAGAADVTGGPPLASVPSTSAGPGGGQPSGTASSGPAASGGGTAAPGTEGGGVSGSDPAATTEHPADASGQKEVLPPVTDRPTGLPTPSPPSALVSLPLPATASAQGKIVDGFPVAALPFPDGTVVVSSSVSAADTILQVTADAISQSSPDSLVGHFQQRLAAVGFWSEPAPAADGRRSVRFVRGADSLTLTTSTTGTGSTRFTLLGSLHTAAG